MLEQDSQWEPIIPVLQNGGVVIIPTDTVYGIVGSALNPDTVARIYALKQRDERKPLIVLIAQMDQVETFGVILSETFETALRNVWPGPVSVILPTFDEQFDFLSRETSGIAFRVPDDEVLLELLAHVGPLVAPSANKEGEATVESIAEAEKIFGAQIDAYHYADTRLEGEPSILVRMDDEGEIVVLRGGQGVSDIPNELSEYDFDDSQTFR